MLSVVDNNISNKNHHILYIIGDTHIGRKSITKRLRVNKHFELFKKGVYSNNFRKFYIQKVVERYKELVLKDILNKYQSKKFHNNFSVGIIFLGDFLDNPYKDLIKDRFIHSDLEIHNLIYKEIFLKTKTILKSLDIPFKFYFVFGNHEVKTDDDITATFDFLRPLIKDKKILEPQEIEIITHRKIIYIDYLQNLKTLLVFIPFLNNNLNEVSEFFKNILPSELKKVSILGYIDKTEIEHIFIFTHNNLHINKKWFNRVMVSAEELEKSLFQSLIKIFPNIVDSNNGNLNIYLFNGHIHKWWIEDNFKFIGSFFPLGFKEDLESLGFVKVIISKQHRIILNKETLNYEIDKSLENSDIYVNFENYRNNHLILLKHLLDTDVDIYKLLEYLYNLENLNRKRFFENEHLFTLQVIPYILENVEKKFKLTQEFPFTIPFYILEAKDSLPFLSNFKKLSKSKLSL